jgi:phosphonate transport system substrate-binding protein
LPQYFLYKHGIDVNKDLRNRYVGSQESAILHAYLGQAAAGATWPPPWRVFQKDHPEEAAQLKVIWKTPALKNNSVMARDDVPPEVVTRVRRLLLGLQKTGRGRQILQGMETARFSAANNHSYDGVRRFIKRFERTVRPVERKP